MENILSQEEVKFLQRLYRESGLKYVKYDEKSYDLKTEKHDFVLSQFQDDNGYNDGEYLFQLMAKIREKIDCYFEIEIINSGRDINLIKIH